jgi:hypothetical protein
MVKVTMFKIIVENDLGVQANGVSFSQALIWLMLKFLQTP